MASQVNSIIERTPNNSSETLSKEWRGRNTPKDILWSHHYPDTKTQDRPYLKKKKKKLQANILDEYRCKNSQQNISKWKLTTDKKDHTPWPRWTHLRVITIVQQMQINQWDTPRQQEKRQKPHDHLNRWRKSIWSNTHSQ